MANQKQAEPQKQFVASAEAKSKAKTNRIIAIILWVIAIAGEIYTIMNLIHDDKFVWLLVAIGLILVLAVVGNLLWKKANRLDPASEKNKTRFFIQNQLGAIISVLAFLPLILFIFLDKDASKKTKGIAGAAAVVALIIGGVTGMDLNPPSVEKYTQQINEQTQAIEDLNDGVDHVYWTKAGNKYHLFSDCQHIKNRDQFDGTVKDAWEARKIGDSELCLTCKRRAEKRLGHTVDLPDENSNIPDPIPLPEPDDEPVVVE